MPELGKIGGGGASIGGFRGIGTRYECGSFGAYDGLPTSWEGS